MRSAIELIAFSEGCVVTGTLLLLDSAVSALESAGDAIGAAHVDLARQRYILIAAAEAERNFHGISELE
jgi:hypothetical protein